MSFWCSFGIHLGRPLHFWMVLFLFVTVRRNLLAGSLLGALLLMGMSLVWLLLVVVCAVLAAPGRSWRRRKKSPTKQEKLPAHLIGHGGSVQVSVSLMPRLGGCIRVAETMLQVRTWRELAEAVGGMHEPTSPGFCMLL